ILGNVEKGGNYEITVEGSTNGNFTNYFTAFIDWNQNSILDDTGEVYEIGTITNSTGADGIQATTTLNVPLDANLETTRIRIIKANDMYVTDPCSVLDAGQAEDYSLFVDEAADIYCEVQVLITVQPITKVLF